MVASAAGQGQGVNNMYVETVREPFFHCLLHLNVIWPFSKSEVLKNA